MSDRPTRILIVGAGAVGLVYASYLDSHPDSSVQVTLLARSNYNDLKQKGAIITTLSEPKEIIGYTPYEILPWTEESLSSYDKEPFDYVIIATKSLGDTALKGLQNFMSPEKTLLVLFQNGIEIEQPYRKEYHHIPLASAVIRVASCADGPRHVSIFPGGMRIIVGLDDKFKHNKSLKHKLQTLLTLSLEGGCSIFKIVDNIQIARWEKMLWNGSLNMLASILDLSTGVLLDSTEPLARAMMTEIWTIADSVLGAHSDWVPISKVDDLIIWTHEVVPREFVPSTLQDVRKGNQIELEAIMGNMIRAANRENVNVPTLKVIYQLLNAVNFRLKLNAKKTTPSPPGNCVPTLDPSIEDSKAPSSS